MTLVEFAVKAISEYHAWVDSGAEGVTAEDIEQVAQFRAALDRLREET